MAWKRKPVGKDNDVPTYSESTGEENREQVLASICEQLHQIDRSMCSLQYKFDSGPATTAQVDDLKHEVWACQAILRECIGAPEELHVLRRNYEMLERQVASLARDLAGIKALLTEGNSTNNDEATAKETPGQ